MCCYKYCVVTKKGDFFTLKELEKERDKYIDNDELYKLASQMHSLFFALHSMQKERYHLASGEKYDIYIKTEEDFYRLRKEIREKDPRIQKLLTKSLAEIYREEHPVSGFEIFGTIIKLILFIILVIGIIDMLL